MPQIVHAVAPGRKYPDPMTVGEVAAFLRVCEKTVLREISRGRLRAFRFPGGYRIRLADLQEYHMEREHEAPRDTSAG